MDSCSVCRNLVPLPGPSGGFITGGQGIDLAKSIPKCQTCSILWEGLSTLCVQDPEGVQWIALKQDEDAFRLQYRYPADERIWMGLHFYTRTVESPLSNIFKPSRDLEPDTACDRYLTQAEGWVRDCCVNHSQCKERLSTTLPTRVLDVSIHEEFVFLCETEQTRKGAYVALSHVWGGKVPIQTTTENINLYKNGIRLESLPQTFRDAVFMTRLLECRYLWIDSLCIIQDSKEDWTEEAARMADVYGNSYVTIAAVMSANSHGGLFSKHKTTAVKHTIQRAGEDGRDVIVDVRPALEHTSYYDSRPYGLPPGAGAWLLGRAWCFQEYLLSPRVLLFTDWEILWVCLSRRQCNCGQYSKDTRDIVSEGDLKIRLGQTRQSGSVKEIHRLWKDIVDPYSLRDITFATDKLPALAGIAHLFSGRGLGRYINGLWESTLISDLFWETSWQFADYYHVTGRRSKNSLMPSWSWASVDGAIEMNPLATIEGLEVIGISFEPGKSGSLTDVSVRALTLRGIFINARVWCKDGQDSSRCHRRLTADGMNESGWILDVAAEIMCSQEDAMEVYVLSGTNGPGLVLDSVKGSTDTFKRLGKIRELPKDRGHHVIKDIQLI